MLKSRILIILTLFSGSCLAVVGSIHLTDGKSLQSGILPFAVSFPTSILKYQASGILKNGGCSDDVKIKNCFTMVLTASGELAPLKRAQIPSLNPLVTLDTASPSSELVKRLSAPRQRIEILSWPPTNDTSKNLYKWKYYLVNNVHSSTHFFHIVQLFSRTLGGFVIALGLQNGRLVISDNVRPNCGGICPSIPLTEVWGKTLYHRMLVTWGPQGSIEYTVQEEGCKKILLEYVVRGNVPSGGSLKTGLYRAAIGTNSEAIAYVGDFDFSLR